MASARPSPRGKKSPIKRSPVKKSPSPKKAVGASTNGAAAAASPYRQLITQALMDKKTASTATAIGKYVQDHANIPIDVSTLSRELQSAVSAGIVSQQAGGKFTLSPSKAPAAAQASTKNGNFPLKNYLLFIVVRRCISQEEETCQKGSCKKVTKKEDCH